jgi:FkbM family methyltransferase
MKELLKSLLNKLSRMTGFVVLNRKKMDFGISIDRDLSKDIDLLKVKTVFDIGANKGMTALYYKRIFPESIIYSFEPISSTFAYLEKNTRKYNNIKPFNIGFSDSAAQVKVYLQADSGLNSLNEYVNFPDQQVKEKFETVTVETIDDFCSRHNITSIDLLKTDTEGLDLKVLKGAERLIKTKSIKYVLSEVGFNSDNKRNTSFEELSSYLYSNGYKLRSFYEQSDFGNEKFMVSVNALFSLQ